MQDLVAEVCARGTHHTSVFFPEAHTLRAMESLIAANRLVSVWSCVYSHQKVAITDGHA
jgi:hypothetical protein